MHCRKCTMLPSHPTMEPALIFFVNGKKITDTSPDPQCTLLQYLRNKLKLCGVKLGCGEGGCGACTVMLSRYDRVNDKIIHFPVNACLTPVCSMHGMAVTTVEGIGSTRDKLHPVQERIAKAHGSQCGFCTPGIVMSMYTLLRNKTKPSVADLDVTLQGNLCRCTGYRPILEGFKTFTEEWDLLHAASNKMEKDASNCRTMTCSMGAECCMLNKECPVDLYNANEFVPYDSSQEPIFPPELKLKSKEFDEQFLKFTNGEVTWYRPTTLEQLLELKAKHPEAKIVVGNTEIGLEVKFKNAHYPVLIQPIVVEELRQITLNKTGVTIGAAVTLEEIEQYFKTLLEQRSEEEIRIFKGVLEMLLYFAGKQVRSVACIGGNIITGSPISDLNPIWMAIKARLNLRSWTAARQIIMDETFYTGYRRTCLQPSEILISLEVPFTKPNQYLFVHKQSRRRVDDIAIANAAMFVTLQPEAGSNRIADVEMAFGGFGPTTIVTHKTKHIIGKNWDEDMLEFCCTMIADDLPLSAEAPGGMVDYRRTLALSFFFRTYLAMKQILDGKIPPEQESALRKFQSLPPKSTQFFELSPETSAKSPVGQPIVHISALKQATGEAVYLDDMPRIENELQMALVYSTRAHAKLLNVDFSEAMKVSGVVGYVSAGDVPKERNKFGPVHQDEQLFISDVATSRYQIIAGILADTQHAAQKAAKLVTIDYEDLSPCIVTIKDAIEHSSFFNTNRHIEVGMVRDALKNSEHYLDGICRTGYQEHFYFETHGCLAIPKECDEMEIFCSSQHHAEVTDFVARILNVPQSKIVTRIKRIGGGFGGKQSRGTPVAMATAVAAHKYNRPVRLILDRDEDMAMSGGRHPYVITYRVGFSVDGTIDAFDVELYANGGHSYDLSIEVLERAVFHVENCYKIENLRVCGIVCRTNLPSNTAFRGFGAPQVMFAAEYMIREVAEYLRMDYIEVVSKNMYKEGDTTHYLQPIINCNVRQCFDECIAKSNYYERRAECERFNKTHLWKKRGISMVATKYGVGFGVPFLEQSGCLVSIYTDGSVLLTIGGVEMGQGLITKMIQVAANVLSIPAERIHVSESATDKVPNTSPCAASVGSDLNGMAVMKACQKLKARLEPLREQHPEMTWDEIIKKAYLQRINLSAIGHYATPDVHYDWDTNQGTPYNYFTFGAACTEVEIDCLTGDHQVLRTDIVMDLGCSLNPAIDIGQIEGAFMQGYGLFVLEEMLYSPKGEIYTQGPSTYKIPGFNDIPIEFNVSLLKGVSNPRAVYSSKAVGEPPLFLASSAFFAIRDAIMAARKERKVCSCSYLMLPSRLNAPLTAEKIRMLCADKIVRQIQLNGATTSTWNVIP